LVSFEPFVGKHVAVLNAAPRARHADAALRETLATMSGVIVEEASVTIALQTPTEAGMADDAMVARALRSSLVALQEACTGRCHPAMPGDTGCDQPR